MNLAEIKEKSSSVLRSYGIQRASVFGSTARGEERADSDVDLLVRLGRPMGLISYTRFVNELKISLNRDVDVVTEDALNTHLKPFVMKDAQVIYEE
jgi:hypothetical protein